MNDRPGEEILEHADALRAIAVALLGDADAADDAVQETLAAAVGKPPHDLQRIGAWLRAVVRNRARRRLRTDRRRDRRERAWAAARAPHDLAPDEVAARFEIERLVVEAVGSLDEPERSTVVRRYLEGDPPSSIARREGVPVRTVESRLRRGLQRLRVRLAARRRDWRALLAPVAGLATAGRASAGTGLLGGAAAKIAVVAAVCTVTVLTFLTVRSRGGSDTPGTARTLPAREDRETGEKRAGATERTALPSLAPDRLRRMLYHLRHGSETRRADVLEELIALGPIARSAAPELLEFATHEENWWGRHTRGLGVALAAMHPWSDDAIAELTSHRLEHARRAAVHAHEAGGDTVAVARLAFDRDLQVAAAAVAALEVFGEEGWGSLLAMLADPTTSGPTLPIESAFRARGPRAVPGLRSLLKSEDADVRARGLRLAYEIGSNARALDDLLHRLAAEGAPEERAHALDLLRGIGRVDEVPEDVLEAALGSGKGRPMRAALESLAARANLFGPEVRSRVAAILRDPDPELRARAALLLKDVDGLLDAIEANVLREDARAALADAARSGGLDAEAVAREVSDRMLQGSVRSPELLADVLAALGGPGARRLAALRGDTRDARSRLYFDAYLARSDEPGLVDPGFALAMLRAHPDDDLVVSLALRVLMGRPGHASDTVRIVADLLDRRPDGELTGVLAGLGTPEAQRVLGRIAADPEHEAGGWAAMDLAVSAWVPYAVPHEDLRTALRVRSRPGAIALAIGKLGARGRSLLPDLYSALENTEPSQSVAVALAIVRVAGDRGPLGALLKNEARHANLLFWLHFHDDGVALFQRELRLVLACGDWQARAQAAELLGRCGGEAEDATLTALRAMVRRDEADERVRDAARVALRALDGG